MQLLMTGGTGLIGRQLIDKLHKQHAITVVSRSERKAAICLPDNISILEDIDALADFNAFDAIINLAGEPIADKRWSTQQKHEICQSRWQMTTALVNKMNASSSPPKILISGSAIGYYGRQGDTIITEHDAVPHEEFTHEVCREWENIANTVNDSCRVCLLRTGVVLSSHGGALAKMRLPFKLGLGGPIGGGQQYMSWIHIDDMVNGIIYLLEHETCSGAFNFTAPNPVTNNTFVKSFATAVHRPALIPMPAFALKLLMGEASDLLLTGQRVIPKKLLDAGFQFRFKHIQDAFADTERSRL